MALPTSLANARLSRIVSRYSSWVGYYRKRGERKKGKKERKKRKKKKKVKRPSSRPHFLRKRRVPRIFHFERGKGWKSAQETAIILSPLYVARKTRNNAMEFLKDRPLSPADPQRPPFFFSFLHFHLFFLSFFLSFLFFFFFLIFFFFSRPSLLRLSTTREFSTFSSPSWSLDRPCWDADGILLVQDSEKLFGKRSVDKFNFYRSFFRERSFFFFDFSIMVKGNVIIEKIFIENYPQC